MTDKTNEQPKELSRVKSLSLSLFVAVLVAGCAFFLSNYALPITGGKRETSNLLFGLTFLAFIVAFLAAFYTRPSTRKITIMSGVGTAIILLYIGYIAWRGVQFPDAAKQALNIQLQSDDYTLDYVWLGDLNEVGSTTYCVIIAPPHQASNMNAFILQLSSNGYIVAPPTRDLWQDLGCNHLDDVINPAF